MNLAGWCSLIDWAIEGKPLMPDIDYAIVEAGNVLPALQLPVSATAIVSGALASRDYSPLHHDKDYAVNEAGQRDIFMNTPHQAALFERYLSDWAGPRCRLGRMKFSMKTSVYAGESIILAGEVMTKELDTVGCCWLTLQLSISVQGEIATLCQVRLALPSAENDDPWQRAGEDWLP
jgi:hypothetical protein